MRGPLQASCSSYSDSAGPPPLVPEAPLPPPRPWPMVVQTELWETPLVAEGSPGMD